MVSPATLSLSRPRRPRRFDAVAWLTFYIIILYAVPSSLVIGPLGSAGAVSMLFGLASFGLWLLAHIGNARRTKMRPEPVRIALALFMICVGVTYALAMSRPISPDEVSPADVALLSLLSWSGALLVTHDGVSTRSRTQTLVWRIALAGGLLALLGLVQFFTKQAIVDRISVPGLTQVAPATAYVRDGRIRPSGTAIHPLEYGAILSILLPIALHVAFQHRHRSAIIRWLPALLIGGVIAISSSRSAYLSTGVAVLVCAIGWTRRQRLVILALGVAGTVGILAVAPHLVQSVLGLFAGAEEDPSIASRTDSFAVAESFLKLHPFFGRGLGTLLPKYRIFDDQYLLLLVTVGVLGTLAFLGLLITSLVRLGRAFLATRDAADRDLMISLAGALVSGFVSLAFFDAFAFPMTMGTIFLCLGLAGAASRTVSDGDRNRHPRVQAVSPRRATSVSRPRRVRSGDDDDRVNTRLDGVVADDLDLAALIHQPGRARALAHPADAEEIPHRDAARRFADRSPAGFTDHNA